MEEGTGIATVTEVTRRSVIGLMKGWRWISQKFHSTRRFAKFNLHFTAWALIRRRLWDRAPSAA